MTEFARSSARRDRRSFGDVPTADLLEAQKQSLEMVVRGDPLPAILERLTEIVEEHAPDDVVAAIVLLRDGRLYTAAAPSLPAAYIAAFDGREASAENGTCSAAVASGLSIVTQNIERDPKWAELKSLPLALGLVAVWSQPIINAFGEVLGAFGTYFRRRREPDATERVLVETLAHTAALAIERTRAEARARDQVELLGMAFDAAEMGAWRYELATNCCHLDDRAQRLYGLATDILDYSEGGVRAILHHDDISRMWRAVARASTPRGDGRYEVDYRVRKPDGDWRWLRAWGRAEFEPLNSERRAVRIVGASRDVTAQKNAERQRELLVEELNHRVKNTLTIVQSIAAQTLRAAPDPDAFTDAFTTRIAALARTHSLLAQNFWDAAPLARVVEVTLAPFATHGPEPAIHCDGPSATVGPEAAVTLSLVLNELATNAAKYGALSVPGGEVKVTWRVLPSEAGRPASAEIQWVEANGPTVREPAGRGFGSRLIVTSARQLGGEVEHRFEPSGVTCRVYTPLTRALGAPA